jgi:hypothetical protein
LKNIQNSWPRRGNPDVALRRGWAARVRIKMDFCDRPAVTCRFEVPDVIINKSNRTYILAPR